MIISKVVPVLLLILAVRAEKKIELQDIEEDNLKSERNKDIDKSDQPQQSNPGLAPGLLSLDFLKNGLFRYFDNASPTHQPTRYIHQYAVTEQPERPPPAIPKPHYTLITPQHGIPSSDPRLQQQDPSATQHSLASALNGVTGPQQAMVGYLSNVPMQIYLVPQYYNHGEPGVVRASTFSNSIDGSGNYIDNPYVLPTPKTYIPHFSSQPVAYVGYTPPQPSGSTTVPDHVPSPGGTYQVPAYQYQPENQVPLVQKTHYQIQSPHYTETNVVEEPQEVIEDTPKDYPSHTEVAYSKPQEFTQYYTSSAPAREEYRHSHISELPHPNPLLLKGSPSHLAHIPKALPMLRPQSRPVYAHSNHVTGIYTHRPSEPYVSHHYKRRPVSLLDSYIPSNVQVEYMKRGYTNDPLVAYEALSSARHHPHPGSAPRHYERGFLPNQMYHTAAGGVSFGHLKRTPKVDKAPH